MLPWETLWEMLGLVRLARASRPPGPLDASRRDRMVGYSLVTQGNMSPRIRVFPLGDGYRQSVVYLGARGPPSVGVAFGLEMVCVLHAECCWVEYVASKILVHAGWAILHSTYPTCQDLACCNAFHVL